ncbi:mitochondrial ATPase [Trichophyton violaceum]|uniref:Mitochondrial ATPase n=1 Tax=Trichophyton violaceum TaxID=34388 RepID=A0A178FLY5_TRIVO|nr:mitochondrial ATPase [Trichophyton violaceum]
MTPVIRPLSTLRLAARTPRHTICASCLNRAVRNYGSSSASLTCSSGNGNVRSLQHVTRLKRGDVEGQWGAGGSMKMKMEMSTAAAVGEKEKKVDATHGPLQEYESRVEAGLLRDDDHQRAIIQHLQDLHDMLCNYKAPTVVHPTLESLNPQPPKSSFFGMLFNNAPKPTKTTKIPANMPKGLYMHGDVGCGKTMLMDLFYDTLPPSITSKTRIHFHNFMQDVHKRLFAVKSQQGADIDGVPFVAADIAERSSVLCFDEFQCTDVADAMILRRLLESLMSHGVVLVTTSNRHPDDLYKNGIQRESFIPCIHLLKTALTVINLNSSTDYRKIPRPPSGVYHNPMDIAAEHHADKWFRYLGDFENDPPHPAVHEVWGRAVHVPQASGKAARFAFNEIIGRATSAADYIELMNHYNSFIITDVPAMGLHQRDLARRFITFIDAVYESRAKLVLTSAVPLRNLFLSENDIKQASSKDGDASSNDELQADMRNLMDDLGLTMDQLKASSIFSGDEERFAFARALSRLAEMESKQWVERGLGVGMDELHGQEEKAAWDKTRSKWREDSM